MAHLTLRRIWLIPKLTQSPASAKLESTWYEFDNLTLCLQTAIRAIALATKKPFRGGVSERLGGFAVCQGNESIQ
jgi:hypothetical protein